MGMCMTPQDYYDAFVSENCRDFENNQDSVRHGFNASVSASHMADHYYEYYKKNDPEKIAQYGTLGGFLEHIVRRTDGAFRDIRSISNAYKHLYTGDNKYSSINSAGTIDTMEIEDDEITEIHSEYNSEGRPTKVIYTTKDGTTKELLPQIKRVDDFWGDLIISQHAS